MNRPEVQHKGAGAANHVSPRPAKKGTSHKGIIKVIRTNKRSEAEARNEKTRPERTKKYRKALEGKRSTKGKK